MPAPAEQPTEFHNAVAQIVLKNIGLATGVGHLAVLAKAQAVTARTIRRIIVRGELLQRDYNTFTPAEVTELVMASDADDEEEGTGR